MKRAQLVFERRVDAVAAAPIDGDEHRVPAAGPAARRDGALHARLALGHRRVVRRRDRALLAAERLRRVEPRLRRSAADRCRRSRQRIAHAARCRIVATMCPIASAPTLPAAPLPMRSRAVSPSPVERRAAVHAVAEAQHGMAVVLDLDDELGGLGVARQQVALRASSGAGRLRCARRSPGARRPRRRRSAAAGARRRVDQRRRVAAGERARAPAASAARSRCGRADNAARGRRAARRARRPAAACRRDRRARRCRTRRAMSVTSAPSMRLERHSANGSASASAQSISTKGWSVTGSRRTAARRARRR